MTKSIMREQDVEINPVPRLNLPETKEENDSSRQSQGSSRHDDSARSGNKSHLSAQPKKRVLGNNAMRRKGSD